MLEPILNQERPTDLEVQMMWKTVKFLPTKLNNEMIEDMITRIKNIMCDCMFRTFEISPNPHFDWFASRNRLDEINFCKKFLTSKEVLAELPGFQNVYDKRIDEFKWDDSFTLDGELARLLVYGGAYEKFKGTPKQAKKIASQFCHELFQERYMDVIIFKLHQAAWSDWFYEVYLDGTWIVIDKLKRHVHVMCYTDTD